MPTIINSDKAPAAIGPYSQAVKTGNLVFLSGQIPIDPATGELVPGGLAEQAQQVFANIKAVLQTAETSLSNVVKSSVFLADLNDFAQLNIIYAEHFGEHKPARSTFQVAALPKGAKVEIEIIAECP
ncbi:MAG: RidA family protein [Leptospiraceae bacterium]|nr:RidA family protein [Leptospiraceae bacterium]MCB1199161.1 RidA family protein [Leptospiraceae bacterium]